MEPKETARKFFVTIEARSDKELIELRRYGLDLFRASAVRAAATLRAARAAAPAKGAKRAKGAKGAQPMEPAQPLSVEGLLTLPEVERLVLDGYRVTLEEEASRRARGRLEVIEFDEWLKGMEG